MEIVVRGRNVEVPEHYRQHVEDKVGQLDRFDGKLKILRIDVELFHEKNPRQSAALPARRDHAARQGPRRPGRSRRPRLLRGARPGRAKLDNRLRRAADRRRVHHGRRTPASVRMADNTASPTSARSTPSSWTASSPRGRTSPTSTSTCPGGSSGRSTIPPRPMTVDQALHEMELVGHDFFLFQCADTGQPTVVYRRHAYDYGLIRLTEVAAERRRPRRPARPSHRPPSPPSDDAAGGTRRPRARPGAASVAGAAGRTAPRRRAAPSRYSRQPRTTPSCVNPARRATACEAALPHVGVQVHPRRAVARSAQSASPRAASAA